MKMTINTYKPGRQTMQNIQPTEHVPYEDAVRMGLYQWASENLRQENERRRSETSWYNA
jgi:hypothetical protein